MSMLIVSRLHLLFPKMSNSGSPPAEPGVYLIAIRQLKGGDVQLEKFITKGVTLQGVIEALEKERRRVSENLDGETRRAKGLIEKRNNLAVLLKKGARSLPTDLDMKRVNILIKELESDIRDLSAELQKGLSPDAGVLIDNLLGSRLPQSWDPDRIISAIQELLNKGFHFEVKRSE